MSTPITPCTARQFATIKNMVREFELDGRVMKKEEFLTISKNSNVLAFGRIKEHEGFSEMCTLGVTQVQRLHGYGKRLSLALEKKALQPVYLVCTIPQFFTPLGFTICETYPPLLQDKLDYCRVSLPVPQDYVVMCKL